MRGGTDLHIDGIKRTKEEDEDDDGEAIPVTSFRHVCCT